MDMPRQMVAHPPLEDVSRPSDSAHGRIEASALVIIFSSVVSQWCRGRQRNASEGDLSAFAMRKLSRRSPTGEAGGFDWRLAPTLVRQLVRRNGVETGNGVLTENGFAPFDTCPAACPAERSVDGERSADGTRASRRGATPGSDLFPALCAGKDRRGRDSNPRYPFEYT